MFYKIPKIGDYIHVYKPEKAVFAGPDSIEFKTGTEYDEWVPNDFSVIKGDDGWHLIGITHPKPARFINSTDCFPDIHDAEWQLFHAFCPCEKLKEKADSTENKYDDFAVKCFECIVNNDETLGMLVDYIVNGIYELDVDGKVICKANSNIREISEVVAGELSCCKFDANGNHICNSISWIEVARILEMLATLLSAWKTIETK